MENTENQKEYKVHRGEITNENALEVLENYVGLQYSAYREFSVKNKWTSMPIMYEKKANVLGILTKARAESPSILMIDLDKEMYKLVRFLQNVQDDLRKNLE